jgi:hypothetical protein
MAGVVDSTSSVGNIRVSVLKQYGLMDGSSKAYDATPLAKAIKAAPKEELPPLIAQAALMPPIFKSLFDTFHGGEFTRAKLKQRASDLHVHPDSAEKCVNIYVTTLGFANLLKAEGDKILHVHASLASSEIARLPAPDDQKLGKDEEEEEEEALGPNGQTPPDEGGDIASHPNMRPRAVFQVNVALDASLDTDKLERQLALLKKYGAI